MIIRNECHRGNTSEFDLKIAGEKAKVGTLQLTTTGVTYHMVVRTLPSQKNADSKGRVTVGDRFANRAVIVEQRSEDKVVVRLARVIPEREAWLYENLEASASVRRGLDQARKGEVAKNPPDMKAAIKLAAQLED